MTVQALVPAPPLIHAHKVSKCFRAIDGGEVVALIEISFDMRAGEFVCVVGPSGCGKTTLLKIMAGLQTCTSGHIDLAGRVIDGPRADVGIVFQEPILLPWRTVMDNVMLAPELQHLDRSIYAGRAQALLDLVGLQGFEGRYPRELSGGMRQRVAIVRALVHDPSIVLMDEPFGALDAMTRERMNVELLRIWEESRKSVFFITHSIPEAVFLADRVLVMSTRPGQIVETIHVDLTRPRGLDVMGQSRFGELTNRIRLLLNAEGRLD